MCVSSSPTFTGDEELTRLNFKNIIESVHISGEYKGKDTLKKINQQKKNELVP